MDVHGERYGIFEVAGFQEGYGMIRSVVLPNVGCMLLDIGYIVFMFMWLIPQMDVRHSNGDAFVVMMGVLVGFYGLATPFYRIVDAYIAKWVWELEHYKSVKNTFALFNQRPMQR